MVNSAFSFTQAPTGESLEWPGTPIGRSNVITRTKSRTAVSDKSLDSDPPVRDDLIRRAQRYAAEQGVRAQDVVIHGIRVRAVTNSPHLLDFWVDNWFGVEEWRLQTGQEVAAEPQVVAYALVGVPEQEAAYYSRQRNTIVFFNTAYYGQLKSWVLGAVGRLLASRFGIHSIHGASVELNGDGILFIAPTGTGKSTSSYGLMSLPGSLFHSDDWVYLRYSLPLKDGGRLVPRALLTPAGTFEGYRLWDVLIRGRARLTSEAVFQGALLDGTAFEAPASAVDLDAPPQAHAYISERRFYLRTNLVESFPEVAQPLLRAKLENVPDTDHSGPTGCLAAFGNARAIIDPAALFTPERAVIDPLKPVHLHTAFILRRDRHDPAVLERLPEARFLTFLLRGRTPDGGFESFYNAYRAVDDRQERAFIDRALGDYPDELPSVDALFRDGLPESLAEEITLFRVLARACATYSLNTILTADPEVSGLADAVARTVRLIAAVVQREPAERLGLGSYKAFLRGLDRGQPTG